MVFRDLSENAKLTYDSDGTVVAAAFQIGGGGKGASPGDVTVAGGIERVAGFPELPPGAIIGFAEGKEIGSNVLLAFGKAFFSD